jgi:hypothetical protein
LNPIHHTLYTIPYALYTIHHTLNPKPQTQVGDGMEVLEGLEGGYDLVFLDANKKQYSNYLSKMLDLGTLRVGYASKSPNPKP